MNKKNKRKQYSQLRLSRPPKSLLRRWTQCHGRRRNVRRRKSRHREQNQRARRWAHCNARLNGFARSIRSEMTRGSRFSCAWIQWSFNHPPHPSTSTWSNLPPHPFCRFRPSASPIHTLQRCQTPSSIPWVRESYQPRSPRSLLRQVTNICVVASLGEEIADQQQHHGAKDQHQELHHARERERERAGEGRFTMQTSYKNTQFVAWSRLQ